MRKYPQNILSFSFFLCLFACLIFTKCTNKLSHTSGKLFQEVSSEKSGITFENRLIENDSMNFFSYGYFYLGGGVAVGDFDNNGWRDLFFTGNMVKNELYLNKGNLTFENISEKSGVADDKAWSTGCSVVDINTDGLMDIYVSVAGIWESRENKLYINKGLDETGIPIFEEQATQYGLADAGNSIQTAFLDYDLDGDLDVFVANYEPTSFNATSKDFKEKIDNVQWIESDHLYRNNGDNTFTDVTQIAGLFNFGLTLGVVTADLNNDGWTDLYLSNDFHSPDRLYLNQKDGTFKEVIKETTQHTSFYGMGIDAADYNNDGHLDLMQADMSPADNFRSKANMGSMDVEGFKNLVKSEMHYQYMYNSFQTCQGVRENGLPFYAETAKLSGLDKTDWSWSCLFGDYDMDGYKDLFVTNGTRRDINNKDYFKWLERVDISLKVKYKELSAVELCHKMPFKKVDNYIFKNLKGEKFQKQNKDWGLHFEGFSNGAAYADLDNDGDLELIVNNIDSAASIFKNFTTEQSLNNYLNIELKGSKSNPLGIGTKIELQIGETIQYQEHSMVRGYQSSIDDRLFFGLGNHNKIDELRVFWADGKTEILKNVSSNQTLKIEYTNAQNKNNLLELNDAITNKPQTIFKPIGDNDLGMQFTHIENEFDDYKREVLLPHQMSSFGPALATGDINKDGIIDVYIGGAKSSNGKLFVSQSKREQTFFVPTVFEENKEREEVSALFFDPDKDGDLDLYIVTGGNEEPAESNYYMDVFYENNGAGGFELNNQAMPKLYTSGSVVVAGDYDGDGDEDLFVGGRQVPGQYPNPTNSHILKNVSTIEKIEFELVTQEVAPHLLNLGMVTDAIWDDYDGDNDLDLLVVGEWMSPSLFENQNGEFVLSSNTWDIPLTGWWNCIEKGDFDQDGDNDYILGNLGLNYKYKASTKETFDLHAGDLDDNGKQDVVLSYFEDGNQFPLRGMQCSSEQMPVLKKRFKNYNTFASSQLNQIYPAEKLNKSIHYKASEFGHVYIENLGNKKFNVTKMPLSTQISSVNAMSIRDFNQDGNLDVLMGGNLFDSEVETPRNDACYGWLLVGDGLGGFQSLPYEQTGLYIPYETRHMAIVESEEKSFVLFANNNAPLSIYKIVEKENQSTAEAVLSEDIGVRD